MEKLTFKLESGVIGLTNVHFPVPSTRDSVEAARLFCNESVQEALALLNEYEKTERSPEEIVLFFKCNAEMTSKKELALERTIEELRGKLSRIKESMADHGSIFVDMECPKCHKACKPGVSSPTSCECGWVQDVGDWESDRSAIRHSYELTEELLARDRAKRMTDAHRLLALKEADMLITVPPDGMGKVSDGYHTFDELYRHRAALFSVICHTFPERAWKSKKHNDGTMFKGMFIVGLDTKRGPVTYHCNMEHWGSFRIKEIPLAPEWGQYTSEDVAIRVLLLGTDVLHGTVCQSRPHHKISHACQYCGENRMWKNFLVRFDDDGATRYRCPACNKEFEDNP